MTIDEAQDRGRTDLYYLSKAVLGYDKLHPAIHRPWCARCQHGPLRRVYLHPRGTFKTVIYTISYSIFLLLNNPNIRILICSDGGNRARDILRSIARHLSHNRTFRDVYGNWASDGERWAADAITVNRRTKNLKEPTLLASGRGDQLVSSHWDAILVSDIVSQRDRDSSHYRLGTQRFMEDAISLAELDAIVQVEGTRWATDDWYSYIENEMNPRLIAAGEQPYQFHSESCWDEDGNPRFAAIGLTRSRLEALKIERGSAFHANYENQPVAPEESVFKPTDFEYHESLPPVDELEVYGYLDPAVRTGAKNDYSAIVLLGKHKTTKRVYLVGVEYVKLPPSELTKLITALFHEHSFARFGIESNLALGILASHIEDGLRLAGKPFRLTQIRHHSDKMARILSYESKLKCTSLPKRFKTLYPLPAQETWDYPNGRHDDFIDAWAGCWELMERGVSKESMKEFLKLNSLATDPQGLAAMVVKNPF